MHRNRTFHFLLALLAAVIWRGSLGAATFIVPEDETLIRGAERIVTARVIDSHSRFDVQGAIETVYRFEVYDTLKGPSSDGILELREWGGRVGDQWMFASGAPHYQLGKQYLLFLTRFRDGRLTTFEASLGRFELVGSGSESVFVRDLGDATILGPKASRVRPADEFLDTIRQVVVDRGHSASGITLSPLANDLDTRAAAAKGASQWSSGSTVSYTIGTLPATGNTKGNDGEERILIDDPHGDIAGSFGGSGTIAIAFFGGTMAGFTDRVNLTYSDIVVQDGVSTAAGVSQEEYATVMTHELGHTLGFRHANQNKFSQNGSTCTAPLPCSTTAIMNSFVLSGLNGALQSWDKAALQTNYGAAPNADYLIVSESSLRPWYRTNRNVVWRIAGEGSACNGPVITSGPVAVPPAIESGQTSQLSVSATASQGSIGFQWYRGTSGDTSSPLQGGGSNTVIVQPSQTMSYWVRVTDGCSSVDSNTVQVTVSVCEPVITTAPQNRVIGVGESATLTVVASNATSYAWYRGASGNTSIFEGSGPVLVVSPSQTTSYWVRISNACGSVDSAPATVQVLQCPPPVIFHQPRDVEIQPGETATLQVMATGSGTLRYEWFAGASGDASSPVGQNASVFVTPPLQAEARYWVRIHDDCGFSDSRAARVRVVTTCTPLSITSQPQDQSVVRGNGATLSVEVAGTSPQYQWYRLAGAIVFAISGATGPTLETGPLEGERIYFARIRNNCGSIQTRQAVIGVVEPTSNQSRRRLVRRP